MLHATVVLPFLALVNAGVSRAGSPMPHADRIVVLKRKRQLMLMQGKRVLARFHVALGSNPVGPKRRAGDGRTPEGTYFIEAFVPDSDFYRALKISYPSAEDIARARRLGVDPGGQIMIHGLDPALDGWEKEHWMFNWTNGCIAVSNREMDILWHSVSVGTPVEIRP